MKHVYIMQRKDGAIKVGVSINPASRKVSVETEVRQAVDLVFSTPKISEASTVETISHKILGDNHETGEWFWADVEMAKVAVEQYVERWEMENQ